VQTSRSAAAPPGCSAHPSLKLPAVVPPRPHPGGQQDRRWGQQPEETSEASGQEPTHARSDRAPAWERPLGPSLAGQVEGSASASSARDLGSRRTVILLHQARPDGIRRETLGARCEAPPNESMPLTGRRAPWCDLTRNAADRPGHAEFCAGCTAVIPFRSPAEEQACSRRPIGTAP